MRIVSLLCAQQIPLDQWIDSSRLDFEYFAGHQEFLLKKEKGQSVRFGVLSHYVWLEKEGFEKTEALIREGNQFYLPHDLYRILRAYFEETDLTPVKPKITAIVLDAGHGGRDLGAIATHTQNGKKIRVMEKEVVLDITKRVERRLTKSLPKTDVVLTRTKDVFLTLNQRVRIANSKKPEFPHELIFISIHANFSPQNKKAQGFEAWSLPDEIEREVAPLLDANFKQNWEILNSFLNLRYKTESRRLAAAISEAYTEKFSEVRNRGLKQESWFVVKNSYMPAVLIEVGFISSEEEALLLLDDKHLDKLAEVIALGIKRFVDGYK